MICHQNSKRIAIFLLTIVAISYSSFAQQIGYLKIKVNETATIYLNNRNLGDYGPNEEILREVPLGTSQVKVMKDGYETQTKNVTISVANEIKEISFLLQRPQSFQVEKDVTGSSVSVEYGELTVITKLSGSLVPAKVYVDGKFADNAPVKLSKLFVGIHTIEVDYNSIKKSKTISIEKNKKDVLEIELLITSQVTFRTDISGVEGYIDSDDKFGIPSVKFITSGEKTLTFTSEGYYSVSKKIFIDGASKYTVSVNLATDLPTISPEDIGRTIKKPYDASYFPKKQESKTIRDPFWRNFFMLIGAMVGGAIGSQLDPEVVLGAYSGVAVGIAIPLFSIKPKIETVPIEENIRYNQYEAPKMLYDMNLEVTRYNQETQSLIKQKQNDRYSDQAIIIQKQ